MTSCHRPHPRSTPQNQRSQLCSRRERRTITLARDVRSLERGVIAETRQARVRGCRSSAGECGRLLRRRPLALSDDAIVELRPVERDLGASAAADSTGLLAEPASSSTALAMLLAPGEPPTLVGRGARRLRRVLRARRPRRSSSSPADSRSRPGRVRGDVVSRAAARCCRSSVCAALAARLDCRSSCAGSMPRRPARAHRRLVVARGRPGARPHVAGTGAPPGAHAPIYVAALAAQFAFDYASDVPLHRGRVLGVSALGQLQAMLPAFVVDTMLAPLGLLVAFPPTAARGRCCSSCRARCSSRPSRASASSASTTRSSSRPRTAARRCCSAT